MIQNDLKKIVTDPIGFSKAGINYNLR